VTRHLADIGPSWLPKSGHVTITKIENLHIDARKKLTDSKNAVHFDPRRKKHQGYRGKTASNSGVTRLLVVLN